MDNQQIILRVLTDECRYRFELSPYDTYGKLLSLISEKIKVSEDCFEVYTQNGKRLNIRPDKRIKDVIYLNSGSILKVQFQKSLKTSAMRECSSLSPEAQILEIQSTRFTNKCSHPESARCLSCAFVSPTKQKAHSQGKGVITAAQYNVKSQKKICNHGPTGKCLNCITKIQEKPIIQEQISPKSSAFATPNKKSRVTIDENCTHSMGVTCFKCNKATKTSFTPKTEASASKPNLLQTVKEPVVPIQYQVKSCTHGQATKCINCLPAEAKAAPQQNKTQIACQHGENSKCIRCITNIDNSAAHLPFDEYLHRRKGKCKQVHPKGNLCSNCLPPVNLRLFLNKYCKNHQPYPRGICNQCVPENVSIKRQEYRHVDYVQFMNGNQVQDFINYWVEEKQTCQMRVGFLYGYYAEDPHYINGIRAIVEAIYEPDQFCSYNQFQIRDSIKRTQNVELVMQSLQLEKIGIIMTSCHQSSIFTERQIRLMAKLQEEHSIRHSTGYKLSNFITVLVKKKRDSKSDAIEPEVYMVSDQGQTIQASNLFLPNQSNSTKMKIRTAIQNQILPTVYCQGKPANQFQVEFLLVKIASGGSKTNKHAVLKNNQFPSLGRGKLKKTQIKEYILKNRNKPALVRYGDINLLLYIAEYIETEIAMAIANQVANEEEIQDPINVLVERRLEALIQ